jgi:hypothetical protein
MPQELVVLPATMYHNTPYDAYEKTASGLEWHANGTLYEGTGANATRRNEAPVARNDADAISLHPEKSLYALEALSKIDLN